MKIMRFILALEIIIIVLVEWNYINVNKEDYIGNNNEWYFISFIISVLYSTFISSKNKIYYEEKEESLRSYDGDIEMKDMSIKQ